MGPPKLPLASFTLTNSVAAKEWVRLAKEQGLTLDGPKGLLGQFTKTFLETALNEEMTEHIGHEKNRAPDERDESNVRNGTRPKTVISPTTGPVTIQVPRDRDATFAPVIVPKRQRRLTGVDETVLSLYARGLTTGEISAHFNQIYGAQVSSKKDWDAMKRAVKPIYTAPTVDAARAALDDLTEIWGKKYGAITGCGSRHGKSSPLSCLTTQRSAK